MSSASDAFVMVWDLASILQQEAKEVTEPSDVLKGHTLGSFCPLMLRNRYAPSGPYTVCELCGRCATSGADVKCLLRIRSAMPFTCMASALRIRGVVSGVRALAWNPRDASEAASGSNPPIVLRTRYRMSGTHIDHATYYQAAMTARS
eukprot:758757-Rhodomonas_salina.1